MSATIKHSDQKTSTAKRPREGSVVWAAIQVLDDKRTPMAPGEILAAIQKRGLARKLDGKTPEASVAARLAVHTAQGLYFERPEKGKYLLKKGVTAKSLAAIPASRVRASGATTRGRRAASARGRRTNGGGQSRAAKAPAWTAAQAKSEPAAPATEQTDAA